jgi:hypothetical protein
MRVRRDGWRRDGGRFMRSRVVVVVGVVLLEPSCVDILDNANGVSDYHN